jgi:DNA repair protein RadC
VLSLRRYTYSLVREATATEFGARIDSPTKAIDFLESFSPMWDRECVYVLYLDVKRNVTGMELVAMGSDNGAILTPRQVFRGALVAGAHSIIILHNHPSGDTRPSPQDHAFTKKMRSAGDILGIKVDDSIVVGNGTLSFISLATAPGAGLFR